MDIKSMLGTILGFLNTTIVPFIYTVAFIVFLVNVLRYFIIGGGNEESRESAKRLAIWGFTAFVIMFAIWGIVNIFIIIFGLGEGSPIVPDYMSAKQGGQNVGGGALDGSSSGPGDGIDNAFTPPLVVPSPGPGDGLSGGG